jgi:putative aminopeptidase FrvX
MEKLLLQTQKELFDYIAKSDFSGFDKHIKQGKYILLIATKNQRKKRTLLNSHLDTINDSYNIKLESVSCYDDFYYLNKKDKGVCLGADDRAGVWIMLKLLKANNTNYNYLFTCDEERGGVGVDNFVGSQIATKLQDFTTCVVGLDRRGSNEIATYNRDNSDLNACFLSEGYSNFVGSYSDCATLSDFYRVACVNLSIGYNNEHTRQETLDFSVTQEALSLLEKSKICNFLNSKKFTIEKDDKENYFLSEYYYSSTYSEDFVDDDFFK